MTNDPFFSIHIKWPLVCQRICQVDHLNMLHMNSVLLCLITGQPQPVQPAYANVAAYCSLVMSPSWPTSIIHSCWTLLFSIPSLFSSAGRGFAAADEVTERWDVSWLPNDGLHLPMQSNQIKEKSMKKTKKRECKHGDNQDTWERSEKQQIKSCDSLGRTKKGQDQGRLFVTEIILLLLFVWICSYCWFYSVPEYVLGSIQSH